MEPGLFIILRAEVEAQMALIESIQQKIEVRSLDLTPEDEVRMESLAYQIHNLYNAIEDLFKIIATAFENQIKETGQWHTALLNRMMQAIPGMRPALVSQDTYILLNGLKGFRHFFRHAYGVPIEYAQLQINLDKARHLRSALRYDVDRFLEQLNES